MVVVGLHETEVSSATGGNTVVGVELDLVVVARADGVGTTVGEIVPGISGGIAVRLNCPDEFLARVRELELLTNVLRSP